MRLQKVTSGAFAVPELLAGRLDITFSNHPSLIQNFDEVLKGTGVFDSRLQHTFGEF